MSELIVINGKFMSQRLTGVQRYAREILLELDKILTDSLHVEIAVNRDAKDIPDYKNIAVRQIGRHKGNMWEQLDLPAYVIKKGGTCVSLCNMTPILTPHCVVIHDVNFKVNPQFFSWKFSVWYRFVFALLIRRIRKIITVSNFSRDEIERCYKVSGKDIAVISSGWQHFERIAYAEGTLQKYGLKDKDYYISLISMAPNKNLPWIIHAAKNHPGEVFAVCGAVNTKIFGKEYSLALPPNLKLLGYVSDEDAKTLMRDCKAFVYPTFYEGFGLPPLEAMSTGAKAVVSNNSCMREVYGDSVYYIDPHNADVDLEKLLTTPTAGPEQTLNKYSWEKSARKLKALLEQM